MIESIAAIQTLCKNAILYDYLLINKVAQQEKGWRYMTG